MIGMSPPHVQGQFGFVRTICGCAACDVDCRYVLVAIDHQHVAQLARLQGSDLPLPTHDLGAGPRGTADWLQRYEPT
jgi:hypothetical protein